MIFSAEKMDNYTGNCNTSLSDDVRKMLVAIFSTGGFVGVLSCSLALGFLAFFKMYHKFSERLVLYLLLSGLFVASVMALMITGVALDFDEHHQLCQAISFLVQYSIWILLLITTFIIFHLASLVFFYKTFDKLEIICVVFSLVFPLLFSWIPFIHDTYGLSGAWCWIRVYHHSECTFYSEGLIEQYVLWYVPFFLILLVNSTVTIVILIALCYRAFRKSPQPIEMPAEPGVRRVAFEEPEIDAEATRYKKALKDTLPLLAYPIIYNFFSWFTLANRVRRSISPDPDSSHVSWIIHAVAAPTWASFAGITFIVYIIAKKKLTKQAILKALKSWKRTLKRKENTNPRFSAKRPVTDVLTGEGYTVTAPSEFEVPQESEVDDDVLNRVQIN